MNIYFDVKIENGKASEIIPPDKEWVARHFCNLSLENQKAVEAMIIVLLEQRRDEIQSIINGIKHSQGAK